MTKPVRVKINQAGMRRLGEQVASKIEAVLAEARADLAGHPLEEVREELTRRLTDSGVTPNPEAVAARAADIASLPRS